MEINYLKKLRLFLICKTKKKWNITSQKNKLIREIKKKTTNNEKVFVHYQGE